ncbi:YceI family protein [Hymenobacter metallicola]|uniref:YceI family protein n=1 Tax=Hymenobacter metallicola TaxID=2563114 RepID=A0A4Z0Q0J4_9BACT|nr:YceI family protein [Hymenobacter metallicola]TGE23089.1 YceI family protein [Hymenobacter metallicola]
MKTFFALLLTWASFAFQTAPLVYQADPVASKLTWTGHAEVGSWAPAGTVQLRRGQLEVVGHALRKGRFEVDMRTIAHSNTDLQRHLQGTDFFDVAQFPTAVFELREVVGKEALGQLTLRGITKPLRFPVTVTRTGRTLRVQGTATVDRTQYGVRFNSSSFFQNLGDQAIRNDFQLTFDLVATAGAGPAQ